MSRTALGFLCTLTWILTGAGAGAAAAPGGQLAYIRGGSVAVASARGAPAPHTVPGIHGRSVAWRPTDRAAPVCPIPRHAFRVARAGDVVVLQLEGHRTLLDAWVACDLRTGRRRELPISDSPGFLGFALPGAEGADAVPVSGFDDRPLGALSINGGAVTWTHAGVVRRAPVVEFGR